MTKSELIDAIAGRGELTKARAELVVNCVFDAMTEALQRGEGIEIRGFGSFTVRPYKPYNGRNPRTGQPVPVPAKRLPFFKVGKELKELVNNSRSFAISGGDDGDEDDGRCRPRIWQARSAHGRSLAAMLPADRQLEILCRGTVDLHVRAALLQR